VVRPVDWLYEAPREETNTATRIAAKTTSQIALVVGLCVWAGPVLGWANAHEKITRAAFDVQPKQLQALWSQPYKHPHDSRERTINHYLCGYSWWTGNPDHVQGPLTKSTASNERAKNYIKNFAYGEKDGEFAVPTPRGLPKPESGPVWLYHYFGFAVAESRARYARGAKWYFERIIEAFRDGRPEDAAQFAGSFAHTIEDRSSPWHAWDGYDAERKTIEARHNLLTALHYGRSAFWALQDREADPGIAGYKPKLLGATPDEAAKAVARRMEAITDQARTMFADPAGFLGAHLKDDWQNAVSSPSTDAAMSEIAKLSTRLVADMFFTGYKLSLAQQSDDMTNQ